MDIRGIKMRVKDVVLFTILITLLTLIIPAASVEGASVQADFTITADKIIRPDIHKYEWETYAHEVLSFDASDSTSAKNFSWDFGDNTKKSTNSKFITHTYQHTGRFQINLTVSDDEGNTDTIYGNITVVDRPLAVLEIKDAKTGESLAPTYKVYVGQEVLFDGSKSKGDIKTYYFGYNLRSAFIPQASKNNPNYTYTYHSKGDYKVGLRVVDRLGNKSETPKEEFITLHVVEKSSDSGSSLSLPVPLPLLLGGIGIGIVLAVVGILYHMGYIGPFMTGGGGTSEKSDEEAANTVPNSELDSLLKSTSTNIMNKNLPSPIPELPKLEEGIPPAEMKESAEEKTVYETKKCPKCGGKIPITSMERPLKVTCPSCNASFMLKEKTDTKKEMKTTSSGKKTVKKAQKQAVKKKQTVYEIKKCPKCGGKIPITSMERPLKVRCPSCNASFTLKAKQEVKKKSAQKGAYPSTASMRTTAMPSEDTDIVICPSCGKALPIASSQTSVKCDACGTEFEV